MTRSHWAIGEILSLLQDEFPEVTISKIRFLEGQGLIAPERTPSGYRRFYPDDFEQLKWILTQQRDNYLPLKVIREQIQSGSVDFGSHGHEPAPKQATLGFTAGQPAPEPGPKPAANQPAPKATPNPIAEHKPAPGPTPGSEPEGEPTPGPISVPDQEPVQTDPAGDDSGDLAVALTQEELALRAGCSAAMLGDLDRYGFLEGQSVGTTTLYGRADLAIVHLAMRFADHGLEPRHLRAFRLAAERQVGLFAQIIGPQLRRSSLEARQASLEALDDMNDMAADLHRILIERSVAEQLPKHQ